MRHLDLFSGIGGFALAAQWAGMQTIGFSEIDEFACKVLAKNFPEIPNIGNMKEITGNECGSVDIVTGGFPCQPFSKAGKQKGKSDERWLWPEMLRVIKQARPSWVLIENVVDLEYMGLDQVCFDLEADGYSTRPFIIPAGAVKREHGRERLWVVAHDERTGAELEEHTDRGQEWRPAENTQRTMVPQRYGKSCSKGVESGCVLLDGETFSVDGQSEPTFLGSAHGIPNRMDRRKALGNAIVPQVAYEILKVIAEIENRQND